MPLIFKEKFENDCLMGIWEIREKYEDIFHQVQLLNEEREKVFAFQSEARKIEFLSVRVLLKTLIGECGPIIYNDRNKPFLLHSDFRISISHSQNLTAIMLSKTQKIGIDLEYMSHQIENIEHKFINENEFIIADPEKRAYHLYIHWCAKESLYKVCDKQDINFKKNLTIEPFKPEEFGVIVGWVDNVHWHDKFELRYFTINNYVVVYCCKNI